MISFKVVLLGLDSLELSPLEFHAPCHELNSITFGGARSANCHALTMLIIFIFAIN